MPLNPFDYPTTLRERRHGPAGYDDYTRYKPWLRDEFSFRCAYCGTRELFHPWCHKGFGIDHFIPKSLDEEKVAEYKNLIYSCIRCNSYKREQIVPNPEKILFRTLLAFDDEGGVKAVDPVGRDIIDAFFLDDPDQIAFRRRMIAAIRLIEETASGLSLIELQQALAPWLGYPSDLPNLRQLRVPFNSKPRGALTCCYERRLKGTLPLLY